MIPALRPETSLHVWKYAINKFHNSWLGMSEPSDGAVTADIQAPSVSYIARARWVIPC